MTNTILADMKPLILASTSPRRKLLLEEAGFSFLAVASDFEEFVDDKLSPYELVKTLALGKAQAVAAKYPRAVILSGDTIVVLGRTILGNREMRNMLRKCFVLYLENSIL